MRMRYHELVGRRVVTAGGTPLGHVVDLSATACGERLVVDAMLVGPVSFLTRIGLKRPINSRLPLPRRVPWDAVIATGQNVTVRDDWDRRSSPPRHAS